MITFRKFFIGFFGIAILAIMCFWINYNDLSWNANKSDYIDIIVSLGFIVSNIFHIRYENKKIK